MSKKTLYFDRMCGYTVYAVTESGKLTEFNYEKSSSGNITGNIYKGRVESVLPGMQAAFINCGLEKNCYLSTEANLPDSEKYEAASSAEISAPELNVGDEILVQVINPPIGNKGAKVTARPSFVGKFLIYMPDTPFIGVSGKIADEELRHSLAFAAGKMKRESEGLVLRTAAPYAKRDMLITELTYLRNIYADVKAAYEKAECGALIYSDLSLTVRVLRDTLSTDIDNITVGDETLLKEIENTINKYPRARRIPVKKHDSPRDMFEETGVSEQILSMATPRANLDNGGYLIIEKTEALTTIDVNTGKFTGDDSLEQTVYYTNVLAAREIARQVRLRNIGGIVVVDFIDMQNPAHRKAIVEELERALKSDKARCAVSPMSKFGLVEFTRKRTGASHISKMTKPCEHCGAGRTPVFAMVLLQMRAKLLSLAANGAKRIRIDLNADTLEKFLGNREAVDDILKKLKDVKLYAVGHKSYHDDKVLLAADDFALPDTAVEIK